MGLEFQARAFVHLREGDELDSLVPPVYCKWYSTGSRNEFRHFSADAKSASFKAAHQIFDSAHRLKHSIGFVSVTADPGDCRDNRDRAYLLSDGFREVNTRGVEDPKVTPPGLFDHFAYCRDIALTVEHAGTFCQNFRPFESAAEAPAPMAGWFFLHKSRAEFDTATSFFPAQQSVTRGQSSGWDDDYLFFGDTADIPTTVDAFKKLSSRFATGAGLLFVIRPDSFEQIAILHGGAWSLFPIRPKELKYHDDVRFNTGNYGYAAR